ncbi:MAG: helix-turn-helix domain-containing protein [Actinobacteria bacterium]|nr:helix-turn-helix domain-containing protein [Actinomycetota bacterium]
MSRDPFVKLPHAVIDHADLDLHEFAVYIVLLRFRDPKTGKCWPGMSTIADAARMSVNTVRKTIKRLEERGLIEVERVKAVGAKTNDSNRYTIALLPEDPMKYLGKSAKGQRKPRRELSPESRARLGDAARKRGSASEVVPPSSASEVVPENDDDQGSASEVGGSASEVVRVVPRRHPKKNQLKKNHEEDLTRAFGESTLPKISFNSSDDEPASEAQVTYIKDLAIHLSNEAGYNVIPDDLTIARWRKLTRSEADNLIRNYLKNLGRPDEILYPQYGTPEYAALSPAGKAFADTAGMPDSVWEYGFKLKENTP